MEKCCGRREWLAMAIAAPIAGAPILASLWETRRSSRVERTSRSRQVLFGAALEAGPLFSEPGYATAFARRCRICTIPGPLYWANVEPHPGSFSFDLADKCLAFAESHNILARGHTLVWHEGLPGWIASDLTASAAEKMLSRHVSTVVSRYRGRIYSWDVINEAVAPNAFGALRRSRWFRALGPEYVDIAFRTARLADPRALLAYNEYGLENDSKGAALKRSAVLTFLEALKRRSVPVDCLGVQAHLAATETYSSSGLGAFLREVKQLGLSVVITELDVDDRVLPGPISERDQAVADVYARFLDVSLATDAVDAVITWGLSDRHTWLAWKAPRSDSLAPRPLPFDSSLKPKAAWRAIARRLGITDTL